MSHRARLAKELGDSLPDYHCQPFVIRYTPRLMRVWGLTGGFHRCWLSWLACLFLIGLAQQSAAFAAVAEQTGFISVTEENDLFGGLFGVQQNRHYTQGLKVTAFGGDDFMANYTNAVNHRLPAVGIEPVAADFGLVLVGQNIYTPENLRTAAPIKTDRPYAGWLYGGLVYQRRGELTPQLAVMENFEVNLGVVGPDSLAEQAQTTAHRWLGEDVPNGWHNQIHNEPGLELKYLRSWRYAFTPESARYIDLIGRIGGECGNVFDSVTGGGLMRVGYNLPSDFGQAIIDSPGSVNGGSTRGAPWSFIYLFGGVDGHAIGRDITLDGNTFEHSASIPKNDIVGDLSWGAAIRIFAHFEVTYTHVTRTQEFHGQRGDDNFGSFTFKGTFAF